MFRVGLHCIGPVRSQNAVLTRFSRSLSYLRQSGNHVKAPNTNGNSVYTRFTKRSCVNYYPQNNPSQNKNIVIGAAALGLGGAILYGSIVYSSSSEVEKKAIDTPVLANQTDDDGETVEQPVVEDTEDAHVAEEAEERTEVKEDTKVNETADSSSKVTEETSAANKPKGTDVVTSEQSSEVNAVDDGPQIPDHATYVLIGTGTAAYSAYKAISKRDPKARILMIGEEDYVPYMRPPLSKELWFNEDPNVAETLKFVQWNGRERDLFYQEKDTYVTPKQLAAGQTGTAVICGKKVVSINSISRKVTLDDGSVIGYDKCLIATGGSPKNLPIFENSSPEIKDRVSLYRNIADFKHLDGVVRNAESVTIVGGGFLGSELACALARRGRSSGLKVHQVFLEEGNMGRVFPKYLCQWTTKKVEEEGVHVVPNNTISKIELEDKKVSLSLKSGEKIVSDHVVVAVGLDPRTDLASSAQLEVDDVQGGYRVNSELQARSNIWVAGDAACFYDIKLGRRRVEHHDHAVVSGRLAGENMTGAGKPYWHQSMFWSDLGPHIGYEAIGVIDSSLPTVGIWAKATKADSPKAVVEASDDNIRSTAQEIATPETPAAETKASNKTSIAAPDHEEFGKGIVFYTRNDRVVGIIMWNTFQCMPIARKVLKEGKKYTPLELHELAKQFNILGQE